VAAAPVVVVDAVAAAEGDQVQVVAAEPPVDRAAVAPAAKAADVAARAAVDVAKEKVVTAMAAVATVEASSSRT
jgi:hypothetical protein